VTGATDSPFHVDLRGVVDLLSHHLYSGPRVYLRELLQNSLDAVTARTQDDPQAPRRVRIVPADLSPDGCLHVDDSGIGLDEDGIRAVLATIGASTKRDALGLARESFLGQFGIGLLSCFLVTDEIRVTTRRAGTDETWLWVGRDDGTYSVPSPRSHAPSPAPTWPCDPEGAQPTCSAPRSSNGSRRPTPPTCRWISSSRPRAGR
jgi:molecular chaperone HtpG